MKNTYTLNQEFGLEFSKYALIKKDGEEIKIQFSKLIEESRCPPDVDCFWAGQVAVTIIVDNKAEISIGLHNTIPSTAKYKNFTIHLLAVNYDQKHNFGKEKHYSIKLRID